MAIEIIENKPIISLEFEETFDLVNVPEYDGSYTVTPSEEAQTLETEGYLMTDDLTVGAIPSDYIGSGVPRKTAEILYPTDEADRIINAEQYLVGAQTIKKVIVSGLSADKIIEGTTVKIGDEADDDRIASVSGSIPSKTSSDLTASGAAVNVPSGYYPNGASKSVESGSATSPTIVATFDPSFDIDWNTGDISAHYSVSGEIPAPTIVPGYIEEGTAGSFSINGSISTQLMTQSGFSITPSQSQQTFEVNAHLMTGDITVNPIPSQYIVPSGAKQISTNGTHDVTEYASAEVSVPASAVDSGTKQITQNGNGQDVVGYASIDVSVPNTYAAGDEGKVVSNGALVAQTSDSVTQNGTVDTTLINSLTVNVSGGATSKATGTVTYAETYNTNGNRLITSLENIGFTPKFFRFYPKDRTELIGTSGVVVMAYAGRDNANNPLLTTLRFSNTSGGIGTNNLGTSDWTSANNGYLYCSSANVYMRTASSAILVKDIEYIWEAYA